MVMSLLLLCSCGKKKVLNEANEAVDSYNTAAETYNEGVKAYNAVIDDIEQANKELQDLIDSAQALLDDGDIPYEESTINDLKNALSDAESKKVDIPTQYEEVEIMTVSENAKKKELKKKVEEANKAKDELSSKTIPDLPEIPDYSLYVNAIKKAQENYEKSVEIMNQITAPSDDFVMKRLEKIETITDMAGVTEDNDPNGQLNKQGGYIGCIYFSDSQVDKSELYYGDGDSVIDIGTDGGGAVEIFPTIEDAETRDLYLSGFDGMGFMNSGSHYVEGTCVIRTSRFLTATQQKELTEEIRQVLIEMD